MIKFAGIVLGCLLAFSAVAHSSDIRIDTFTVAARGGESLV